MTRRLILASLALALLFLAPRLVPQNDVAAVEIDILSQVIDFMNGFLEFADGADKFIAESQEREDRKLKKYQAEALRRGLTNFSAVIQNTLYSGSVPALQRFRAYLEAPPPHKLDEFSKTMEDLLKQTEAAVIFLQKDSGDLVLEPAYAELQQSLQQRLAIFKQLKGLEGDATPEQVEQMKQILNMWAEVNDRLRKTIQNLNVYIKTLG